MDRTNMDRTNMDRTTFCLSSPSTSSGGSRYTPITLTTRGSECKRVYNSRTSVFPVEISGLTDLLLLYDLRSGLGDAAFYEISLNFEFLLRAQVHHGIEGQVAG